MAASRTASAPIGLRIVPDHSTLWWFGPRHLDATIRETVDRVIGRLREPRWSRSNSTSFWSWHASCYFEWRAERGWRQRGWLKWALAMWAGPQLLLAQRVLPDPSGDLVPLAIVAHAVLPFERLVADYNSEANHRFCRKDPAADSLIPVKKRRSAKVVATTPYRQEMMQRLGEPARRPVGYTASGGRPGR